MNKYDEEPNIYLGTEKIEVPTELDFNFKVSEESKESLKEWFENMVPEEIILSRKDFVSLVDAINNPTKINQPLLDLWNKCKRLDKETEDIVQESYDDLLG